MFKQFTYSVLMLTLFSGAAQSQPDAEQVMLVLDASGSMWGQIDNKPKITIATEVIDDLLTDWNDSIELGVMTYGHRRKGDCSDIETLIPVSKVNKADVMAVINKVKPKGKTPITESVRQAAESLKYTEQKATVILVSDGLETCDADPCALASELKASGVDFTTHVVGFNLNEKEAKSLNCIAKNTGGRYLGADNATELSDALTKTVAAVINEPSIAVPVPSIPNTINKLDLSKLTFDVKTFKNDVATGKVVATGTSNGIGWTVVANSMYKPLTNMKGHASFNDLPGHYDDLHVGSDFTITFEKPVISVLMALANDNDTGDGPNFKELSPTDFVDADNPGGGTQVRIKDRHGALFYYYDINGTSLSHVNDNNINDGFDLAFFAFSK